MTGSVSRLLDASGAILQVKIVKEKELAHALKVGAYLRRQRPDFAARLVRADDCRPGEWMVVKPLLALYGLWTLRGLKADKGWRRREDPAGGCVRPHGENR